MAPSAVPAAELSQLPKADGSAAFAYLGYNVTSAVNGPIEIGRRDENPFEAVVDVTVRPAAGVGGTAERRLESILQQALRQLIPVREFPRTVIQVTLQISETPQNAYSNTKLGQAQLNLHIIPALLHASILGLLTAAVPMKAVASAVVLAVPAGQSGANKGIKADPTLEEADVASSLHVLGFTSDDELLLSENEGSFTVDELNEVMLAAQRICCPAQQGQDGVDTAMGGGGVDSPSITQFMRSVMQDKVAADLYWK